MKKDSEEKTGIFPFPPLIYIAPLAVGLGIHFAFPLPVVPVGWLQLAIGLPIIGIGVVGALWSFLTLARAGTAVRPERPTTRIVGGGPYRFSRNPGYLSVAVAYTGIAISVNTLWPVIFLPLVLVLISLVIRQEERYLEGKFGEEYLSYKNKRRVSRWL